MAANCPKNAGIEINVSLGSTENEFITANGVLPKPTEITIGSSMI